MARMTVNEFAQALSHALGDRLVSLLLYGSAARDGSHADGASDTLLIVTAADPALFAPMLEPVRRWVRAGHPPPLIFTEREWRESVDAFAIEYEDIRAGHRLLAGRDPWRGITVEPADVRRQLEHELLGKLVHLRQACAAEWDKPKRLRALVQATRAGFLTMLRAVLRLARRPAPAAPDALVREAGALIGFAPDALAEPAGYLDALARTAAYVNSLERTPS